MILAGPFVLYILSKGTTFLILKDSIEVTSSLDASKHTVYSAPILDILEDTLSRSNPGLLADSLPGQRVHLAKSLQVITHSRGLDLRELRK